ncbi:MAG: hypothetical protein WBB19_02175 [Desulforhopalus sp.]
METPFTNFMAGLIDYAGFFPPAGLDIETALSNYDHYLKSNNGWMLGRCVLPATELHNVAAYPGFRCSVIVSPAVSKEELDQLSNFKGNVDMVETRMPESAISPGGCADHLLHLKSRLQMAGLHKVRLFVEAESVTPIASAIATFNNSGSGGELTVNVGYKLRCGGLVEQAFPQPEKVAKMISICRGHGIPIKFTAGMHHPLRNRSLEIEAMQHGFINIFGAALLCWSEKLTTDEVEECLRDEAAQHFQFSKESFSWRDTTISAGEIHRLRQSKVISFGSCAFTEPVEGLISLGFLDNTGA